jgi:hypothetical protein
VSVRPRGPLVGWQPTTPRQRAILADLIDRYDQHHDERTLPRGSRGMFYDLRPHGLAHDLSYQKHPARKPNGHTVNPMVATPQLVQETLLLARRAGKIRESWVADTRAPEPFLVPAWRDADEFASELADSRQQFRLDRQRDQLVYVEVLCEAQDLAPRLARIAEPYGVPVYSGGGFDGLKAKRAFARRAAEREVPTRVLTVTDLDDYGLGIHTSVSEDAIAWLRMVEAPHRPKGWLRFERIAITADQARPEGLLDDDGHAEADGLPVPVMDQLLRDAIERLQDPAGRERTARAEELERGRLDQAIRDALDTDEDV